MKDKRSFWAIGLLALALSACSTTPDARARKSAEFASWPPEVQETVLAGRIDIGFTGEQVRVALGEPDYRYSRTTSDGTTEVWGYRDPKPRIGFGVGFGTGGFGSGVSTGVAVGTGGERADEKVRVIFDRVGRVSAVEETQPRR